MSALQILTETVRNDFDQGAYTRALTHADNALAEALKWAERTSR